MFFPLLYLAKQKTVFHLLFKVNLFFLSQWSEMVLIPKAAVKKLAVKTSANRVMQWKIFQIDNMLMK